MPSRIGPKPDHSIAVRQIVASSNGGDFLEHLIDGMRTSGLPDLHASLDKLSTDRDADIEHMCTSNHQEFVNSVDKLDRGRIDSTNLGTEILNLVQSYQSSTDNLAVQKKNLVDSKSVRQNIDESSEALKESLEVLRLANQVHDLVGKQKHYAALRALDDLQSMLRVRESTRYNIGDLIEKSIPATQKMIAEAVMGDLNTWLFRIRDVSQYIGEVAFYHTEQRRTRQKERTAQDQNLGNFRLNSPIELVADETEEYDVLNDEDAQLQVDFSPLFECIHIHEALGQSDKFRTEYGVTRRRQKDLIIPVTLRINDDEASDLKTLLESIAGFCIVERATMKRAENLRANSDVDELWDSMSQNTINLMSGAVHTVDNAELLLKIVSVVSLFVQTMESWGFYANALNVFLMTLFERHTNLLKRRASEDFHEIVATDDYMPMPISTLEEYDKIIDLGWYVPDTEREDISFPCVLPFSQMYPMCCIDIRNFLSQAYSAPDDHLTRSNVIDETIKDALDELLSRNICQPLTERLNSQYAGQIVQILTNLEHFERACQELQGELAQARTSRSRTGPIVLSATHDFKRARERAQNRIFELVNSKIDDLVETAEYNWTATSEPEECSNYMRELTQYLSNIMSSVLLGVPTEIKDMIYLDALSHAAANILALPLDPSIAAISPACLNLLSLDISHLSHFISNLSPPTTPGRENERGSHEALRQNIEELTQTIDLMKSGNPEEFYDITQRDRKYGAVNAQNGPILLEKAERGKDLTTARDVVHSTEPGKSKASDRFGNVIRGLRRGTESDHKGT